VRICARLKIWNFIRLHLVGSSEAVEVDRDGL
jgi:hypothetical protein